MTRRSRTLSCRALALTLALAGATFSCSVSTAKSSGSLDDVTVRRLECSDWRVRYCLATEERIGSGMDRTVLERLIRDRNQKVANQASISYLGTFVRVDTEFLREHVSLYYRLPGGMDWPELPDISSAKFHRSMLGADVESASAGSSIRVLGVIGAKADVRLLRPFAESKNAYVAKVAAIAIARLGDETEGGAALKRIVERPISSSSDLFHQIDALRLLAELDARYFERMLPAFAREAKGLDCTTPARWWRLTQIAWGRGYEVN